MTESDHIAKLIHLLRAIRPTLLNAAAEAKAEDQPWKEEIRLDLLKQVDTEIQSYDREDKEKVRDNQADWEEPLKALQKSLKCPGCGAPKWFCNGVECQA